MPYGVPPASCTSRSASSQELRTPMSKPDGSSRTSAPMMRDRRMLPTLSLTGSSQSTHFSWTRRHLRPSFAATAATWRVWFDWTPPIETNVSAPFASASGTRYSSLRTLFPPKASPELQSSRLVQMVDGARPEGKWVAREVVEFHDAPPSAAGSALYADASTVALASPTSSARRPSPGVITNTVISRRLRRRRWSTTTAALWSPPGHVLSAISLIPSPALVAQRIELRLVAGVSRAIPRRIHGVRLAITATARSDR